MYHGTILLAKCKRKKYLEKKRKIMFTVLTIVYIIEINTELIGTKSIKRNLVEKKKEKDQSEYFHIERTQFLSFHISLTYEHIDENVYRSLSGRSNISAREISTKAQGKSSWRERRLKGRVGRSQQMRFLRDRDLNVYYMYTYTYICIVYVYIIYWCVSLKYLANIFRERLEVYYDVYSSVAIRYSVKLSSKLKDHNLRFTEIDFFHNLQIHVKIYI